MSGSTDGATGAQHIRATFASADQMQGAVSKLTTSGFDRADVSLPSPALIDGAETTEAGSKPVADEADSRQARTLGASTAAAATALAAAGITIATGGAAAPAIAAAVLAGGAAGGSVFAVGKAVGSAEQSDRQDRAASGDLVLSVRASTQAKLAEAEAILRAAGASDIAIV